MACAQIQPQLVGAWVVGVVKVPLLVWRDPFATACASGAAGFDNFPDAGAFLLVTRPVTSSAGSAVRSHRTDRTRPGGPYSIGVRPWTPRDSIRSQCTHQSHWPGLMVSARHVGQGCDAGKVARLMMSSARRARCATSAAVGALVSCDQHLVMGGQRHPHPLRVGLPPTGRTLHIGEQKRHHPQRSSGRRSGHPCRISHQTRSYLPHRRNPAQTPAPSAAWMRGRVRSSPQIESIPAALRNALQDHSQKNPRASDSGLLASIDE